MEVSRNRARSIAATLALTLFLLVRVGSAGYANEAADAVHAITDGGPDSSDPLPCDQGAWQGLAPLLENGLATQYQRVSCYDPALGCEAMRSVAPAGWQVGGQAYWTMQSGAAPATVDFFIVSPDGSARAGYVSPLSFVVPDPSYQLGEGQWYSRAVASVKAYQNAETYAQAYFQQYTGLTNVQPVDVQYPEGEAAQAIQEYLAIKQQISDATTAQMIVDPQVQSQSVKQYAEAAEVTLRFEMNGVPCKAKVFVMICAYELINTQNIPYFGQFTEREVGWDTGPFGFRYYMAEESRFDEYEAAADLFHQNLVNNGQWSSAVQQVSSKLFQEQIQSTFEQVMQQQQALQQIGAQYVAQSAQNYASSDSMSDAIHNAMEGWTNVVTDREYYEAPDGGYVSLDSNYNHTYSDGDGGFIQTNDPMALPSGWSEVNSVGSMLP